MLKDTIIGTIGPKGRLDEGRTIEIGYGVSEDYRSRGYASEAVGIFCEWYFSHTEIERIKAVTNVDNYPSHKILKHNGFKVSEELEDRVERETSPGASPA